MIFTHQNRINDFILKLQSQHHQFLGDGSSAIPEFPDITFRNGTLPSDCTLDDVDTFKSIYREHCEVCRFT